MPDCIDIEARQQIGEVKTDLVALATDYWGKDGNNGHRSRSTLAQKRLDVLERECEHYRDKVRIDTCFGLSAVKEHEIDHDTIIADAVAKRVIELQLERAKTNKAVEFLKAWGPMATAGAAVLIAFKDIIGEALK